MGQPSNLKYIILKAAILFALFNLAFALFEITPILGQISLYNVLFPGRVRLPYADFPEKAYNLSTFNLEAMFASHEINAGLKPADEFRLVVLGDSSIWGWLLPAQETLTSHLNARHLVVPDDGRRLRAYNLGYPVMSLTKDLLILATALRYQPDMILWSITLESMPYDKQLSPPLLRNNPGSVQQLASEFNLRLDLSELPTSERGFWGRTIVGHRRGLADWLRLQLYGVMWAATGIDQYIPADYTPRMEDLPPDVAFHNLLPPSLSESNLALDVLKAGIQAAGDIPVLLVNEPVFISQGENSDIRYNFFYPRWAYDSYRQLMAEKSRDQHWAYWDAWDVVPAEEFTNSAVHLSSKGSLIFSSFVEKYVIEYLKGSQNF